MFNQQTKSWKNTKKLKEVTNDDPDTKFFNTTTGTSKDGEGVLDRAESSKQRRC